MSDAAIPLSFKPPQVENPAEAYGRTLSLGNMMQQGRLNQERLHAEQLENQKRQEAFDDDALLGKTIAANTSVAPDGSSSVNHQGVLSTLAKAGKGKLTEQYTTNMLAQQRAAIDDHTKQLDLYDKSINAYSNLTTPVVNAARGYFDNAIGPDGTPMAPQATPAQVEAAYQQSRTAALQSKLQGATDAPPTLLDKNGDLDPNALSFVRTHHDMAIKAQENIGNARADLDFSQKAIKFKQDLASGQVKTYDDALKAASGLVSSAANEGQYQAALATVHQFAPATVEAQFDTQYSPDAVKRAAVLGMTPEQRQQNTDREAAASSLADYRKQSLELRKKAADAVRGQTENSRAVDRRQALGDIEKLEMQESQLNRTRVQLGQALNNQALYVSPTGQVKSMAVATHEDGVTKDALVADMAARYQQATGDLKRIIGSKYNQYGRIGVEPGIPLDKIHGAIDAGDAGLQKKYPNLFQPAPAALPASTPPAPAAPPAPATPKPVPAHASVQKGGRFNGRLVHLDATLNKYVYDDTGKPVEQ